MAAVSIECEFIGGSRAEDTNTKTSEYIQRLRRPSEIAAGIRIRFGFYLLPPICLSHPPVSGSFSNK